MSIWPKQGKSKNSDDLNIASKNPIVSDWKTPNEWIKNFRVEEGVTNKAFDSEEGENKPRDSVVSWDLK